MPAPLRCGALLGGALLAWRMTVGDTRAVDVVVLLNDAVTPEPMRPGWKQALAYRMLRLPITREVDLEERLELAAARPVIWPETILVDHAKVNLSDALREACLDPAGAWPSSL
ncbi:MULTISPECIES: hypothetical protein [unclassified Nonomuraea]|uniref:hypothetical protein n=1 Tax=unclassified Nonomuraea TaxID=2593643 RepID=UPI001F44A304|nr:MULTISPECIES: hypothetical protein [unclassified Nonomuraea]